MWIFKNLGEWETVIIIAAVIIVVALTSIGMRSSSHKTSREISDMRRVNKSVLPDYDRQNKEIDRYMK